MPKTILDVSIERPNARMNWGFVMIGGKDQALTLKVGKVRPCTPADRAGLKTYDYIWQINGREVFDLTHKECADEVKKSGTVLSLKVERGDHIVPNFEEIWPSKKKQEAEEGAGCKNLDYYYDAMENGPKLSGHLPQPHNFTTVGKPQIFVNQYDNPIEVYSEDTIDEMRDERLVALNPDMAERIVKFKASSDNPFAKMQARKFDAAKSNTIRFIGGDEKSRGQ